MCLQERCPDAFAAFKARCGEIFDATEVPKEEVSFVDEECVLFELKLRKGGAGEEKKSKSKESNKSSKKSSKDHKSKKRKLCE